MFLQEKHTNGQEEVLNVMGHSGNANLNDREVPPYTTSMSTPASVEIVEKTVTALVRTRCLHTES